MSWLIRWLTFRATMMRLRAAWRYVWRISQFAGPALREAFPFQAAIFQARKRKNVVLSNDWLSQAPLKTMIPGLRLQAEAAILEAEGHMDEALTKLDQSIAASSTIKEDAWRQQSVLSLNRWRAELASKSFANLNGRLWNDLPRGTV